MAKRHIFAVSDLKASKDFIKFCKDKGLVASVILSRFMRLFVAGKTNLVDAEEEGRMRNEIYPK